MIGDLRGRSLQYLRLSVTKSCNLHCLYCRPPQLPPLPTNTLLAAHEIEQLARHLAAHQGLRKVRLTGGEPTLRADLPEIIARLKRVSQLVEICLTTNGLTLSTHAAQYAAAGLTRVNVSLDSLNSETFARLTGAPALERVLAGIDAAQSAGLCVKTNTVVMRGENEEELATLVERAAQRGIEQRFIELMPMGPLAAQWADRFFSAAEMRAELDKIVLQWSPQPRSAESAERYRVTLKSGRSGRVGFISPMSCHFCAACDRLRIAADGAIFPCLMGAAAGSILPALRPAFDGAQLDALLAAAFSAKPAAHEHAGCTVMTHIGG